MAGTKKSKGAAAVAERPTVEIDIREARSRVLQAISKSDGGLDLLGVAGSCGIDLELAGRALAGLKGDGFIIEAPPGHYYVDDESGEPDRPAEVPEKPEDAETRVLNALIDLCGPDGSKPATLFQIEKKTGIHFGDCVLAVEQLRMDGLVIHDPGKGWRPVLPSLDDVPAYDPALSAQENFGIDRAPASIAEADPNANGCDDHYLGIRVLNALASMEAVSSDGMTITDLCRWTLLNFGTVKLLLKKLQESGEVQRQGDDLYRRTAKATAADETPPSPYPGKQIGLEEARKRALTVISKSRGPVTISEIGRDCGLMFDNTAQALMSLEQDGLITERDPGVWVLAKAADTAAATPPTPKPPAPTPPAEQPARLTINQADNTKSGEIIEIPLHRIHPNLNNPRKYFDDDAMAELTENIRQHGLLQPIVVTERRDSKLGPRPQYVIICGERRYRACNNLHFEHSPTLGFTQFDTIPAIVRDVTEAEAAEMALAENVARRDINAMEEARAIQRILELHGADEKPPSQREIALRVGLSQPSIANALKLTELPPDVQDAIQQGKLTASHGRALSRFAKWPEAQSKLAAVVIKGTADGRPIPAIRLEGDLYGVLNLIASDDGPCVYMPGDAWRSEYIATCRECPYDSFILPPSNWDRPICARPAHLRQLIAEEEAAFEARAEEARAKLDAQRAAAVTAKVNDAIERAGIVVRSGQLVTTDALSESPGASSESLGESSSASSESLSDLVASPDELQNEAGVLPQLNDLPTNTYRSLFPGDGCGADCPCHARALDRDRVVEICVDPVRFDQRVKDREKAEKKNARRLLEETKAGCVENMKRGDHPEVIRRAAALAVAPSLPGQLRDESYRALLASIGIDIPALDVTGRPHTGSQYLEAMWDAFAAMPVADLVRIGAARAIHEDFKNVERAYYHSPSLASWFARPLPRMEPEPAGAISETAIRPPDVPSESAAAEDDHRELTAVIAERDSLKEQLEKAREHSQDLFNQLNKLRATQRREEELAGSGKPGDGS